MSSVFSLQQVCVARLRAILNLGLLEITIRMYEDRQGKPRLELVCGGAKAMSSTSAVHCLVLCHFVDDLCQDYGSDRNRQADAADISLH